MPYHSLGIVLWVEGIVVGLLSRRAKHKRQTDRLTELGTEGNSGKYDMRHQSRQVASSCFVPRYRRHFFSDSTGNCLQKYLRGKIPTWDATMYGEGSTEMLGKTSLQVMPGTGYSARSSMYGTALEARSIRTYFGRVESGGMTCITVKARDQKPRSSSSRPTPLHRTLFFHLSAQTASQPEAADVCSPKRKQPAATDPTRQLSGHATTALLRLSLAGRGSLALPCYKLAQLRGRGKRKILGD